MFEDALMYKYNEKCNITKSWKVFDHRDMDAGSDDDFDIYETTTKLDFAQFCDAYPPYKHT